MNGTTSTNLVTAVAKIAGAVTNLQNIVYRPAASAEDEFPYLSNRLKSSTNHSSSPANTRQTMGRSLIASLSAAEMNALSVPIMIPASIKKEVKTLGLEGSLRVLLYNNQHNSGPLTKLERGQKLTLIYHLITGLNTRPALAVATDANDPKNKAINLIHAQIMEGIDGRIGDFSDFSRIHKGNTGLRVNVRGGRFGVLESNELSINKSRVATIKALQEPSLVFTLINRLIDTTDSTHENNSATVPMLMKLKESFNQANSFANIARSSDRVEDVLRLFKPKHALNLGLHAPKPEELGDGEYCIGHFEGVTS